MTRQSNELNIIVTFDREIEVSGNRARMTGRVERQPCNPMVERLLESEN